MSWERARSDDQKAERIRAIQEAAGELFLSEEYHSIGMGHIAQKAGFTRPNLYRYYRSKEEIFLALLEGDLEEWVSALETHGHPSSSETNGEPEEDVRNFSRWWVGIFSAQPRLPRLLPLMSFSLDDNAGEELLRSFKLNLAELSNRIAAVVKNRLSWYPESRLGDFPTLQLALVTGLIPMASRSAVHNKVLEDPRLRHFALEFAPAYEAMLEVFLKGLYFESTAG